MKSILNKSLAGVSTVFILLSLSSVSLYAADTQQDLDDLADVRSTVVELRATDPSLPAISDQKGRVGTLLSNFFDGNGKVRNVFLYLLGARNDNEIMKWDASSGQMVGSQIIDDGTNVGIGNSSPAYKLSIGGSLHFDTALNGQSFILGNRNGTAIPLIGWSDSNDILSFGQGDGGYRFNASNGSQIFSISNSGDVVSSGTITAATPTAANNLTTKSYVDTALLGAGGGKFVDGTPTATEAVYTDGNVGIGTLNPNATLHVIETNDGRASLRLENSSTSNPYISFEDGSYIMEAGSGNLQTKFSGSSYSIVTPDNVQKFFINGSGSVGIGIIAPTEKLDVDGNGQFTGTVSAANPVAATDLTTKSYVDGAITAGVAGAGDDLGNHTATQNIQLSGNWLSNDGGNEGLRVADNGSVGIGNIPTTRFEVNNGTLLVSGTDSYSQDSARFVVDAGSSVAHNPLELRNDNGTIFRVLGTGRVGIGVFNPTDAKLEVAGNIIATDPTENNHVATKVYVDNAITVASNNDINALTDAKTNVTSLFLGTDVGDKLTTASSNTALGQYAMQEVTAGSVNTAVGRSSLQNVTTGSNNVAVGGYALTNDTTGARNTALGMSSLAANTTGNNNTALGYLALENNTTGTTNVAIGSNALDANTTGNYNIGIGLNALGSSTTRGEQVAIGFTSLQANTTGYSNVAVGTRTLQDNTTGFVNTALGSSALANNTTGAGNIALGSSALANNTTGGSNTAVGYLSLTNNTTGTQNVAVGRSSLQANTTGIYNVGVGSYTLRDNTTGNYNIANGGFSLFNNTTGAANIGIGYNTLYDNTTGSQNVGIGYNSLRNNETGIYNVGAGSYTLYFNTTGNYNVANGGFALYRNTTGTANTGIGYNALYDNTTGAHNTGIGYNVLADNTTGNYNVGIGSYTLDRNTTGANNTGIGYHNLRYNTTGVNNTAIGYSALDANTTAANNTALGYYALSANTTGAQNTALGAAALDSVSTGGYNTAIGYNTLGGVTTGLNNTAIGSYAGDNITTGGTNIIIGANIDAPSATASNQLNIGNRIYGNLATGRIGINDPTPTSTLDVQGNLRVGNAYNNIAAPTNGAIIEGNVGIGTSSPAAGLDIATTHSTGRGLQITQNRTSISSNAYTLEVDSSSHTSNVSAAGAMAVDVASGRAFTINGLGRVGIGTSTPLTGLDVLDDTGITVRPSTGSGFPGNIRMVDGLTNVTSRDDMQFSTLGGFMFKMDDGNNGISNVQGFNVYDGADNSVFAIEESNGNVGIGTTTPGQKLDVVGNGRFSGVVVAANPTAPNQLTTKSYVDSAIAGTGDNLGNHTATQNLILPGYDLDLRAPNTTSSWARGLDYKNTAGNVTTGGIGMFGTAATPNTLYMGLGTAPWTGTNSLFVKSNGRVGVGVFNPTEKLDVAGNVNISGSANISGDITAGPSVYVQGALAEHWFGSNSDGRLFLGAGRSTDGTRNSINLYNTGCVGGTCNVPAVNLYADTTAILGNATVAGSISGQTPTAANHLTTKSYVDGAISTAGGNYVSLTGNQTVAGVKTFSSPIVSNGAISAGLGSGGVAMTVNDGYGNANLTFNHNTGRAEQNGNAARIEVNTDATSDSTMFFELGDNLTSGVATNLTNVMTLKSTGRVGIGTVSPSQALDVNGNGRFTGTITAAAPTAASHLTTKSYVDNLVTQGVSWKAPVATSASATYGACNASKEGWATYNRSDDIIYLCNASAWVNIGNSASVPYATTSTAGRVQLSGDIGGTWNNLQLAANSVGTAEVALNSLTAADLAANSVGSSEIANDSIGAIDLAAGSVSTSEVLNDSLTSNDLAANSVGNSELIDNPTITNLSVTPGVGNGIRFWNSDQYAINMGNTAEFQYGPVTDYSIKTNMAANSGRGWTWGIDGATPVFAVGNTGNAQFAGTVTAATPTAASHLATKSYVDAAASSLWSLVGSDVETNDTVDINNFTAIGNSAAPATNAALTIGETSFGGNRDRATFQIYNAETIPATTLTGNRTSYGNYTALTNNKGGTSTSGNRSYATGHYAFVNTSGSTYTYQNIGASFEGRNSSTAGAQNLRGVTGVARQFDGVGNSNVSTVYGGEFQALGRSGAEAGTTTMATARGVNATVQAYHTDITNASGVYSVAGVANGYDGNIANAYGVLGYVNSDSDDGGSVTNGYAGFFHSYGRNTAPIMTNSKGIYAEANDGVTAIGGHFVADDTRATTNYAIYADARNAGTNNFAVYAPFGENYFADNVGIGTNNPTTGLHISDTGDAVLTLEADSDNVTETDNPSIIFKQDGGSVNARIGFESGTNQLGIYNQFSDALRLGTGNAERMRITSAGNVGIKTTAPAAGFTLDVNGDTRVDRLEINSNSASNTSDLQFTANAVLSTEDSMHFIGDNNNDQTGEEFIFGFNSEGTTGMTEVMRIEEAGRVGIGTPTPRGTLDVGGMMYQNQGASYDIWLQGGSGTTGNTRNLALLGHKGPDVLYVNYASEYAGGTIIGGPVQITTAPTAANHAATKAYVDGAISTSGGNYIAVNSSGDQILDNTIDSSEVQANSLTAADLAAGSVGTSEVADNTLTATDLAANSVGNSELIDSPTFTNPIVAGTLYSDTIKHHDNSAGNVHIDAGSTAGTNRIYLNYYDGNGVNFGNGANGVVASVNSAGGASFTSIAGNGANVTNINGDNIQDGTIDASEIQNGTITGTDIATATVTGGNIANNTITETDIADNFVARNSTLLAGLGRASGATANTVVNRDGAADITARLFRSTYAEQTAAPAATADIAFRINNGADNYIRFMSKAAAVAYLGVTNTDTQDLSISGRTISLTNGGSVTVPSSNTDTQDLSISGRTISLQNGGSVTVPSSNTDTQNLSISGNSISLTNGGSVTLGGDNIVDNTIDASELQADSVGASELANDSVASANVVANSLTAADLAAGSVGTSEVANDSLTASDLAPNSVGNSELIASPSFTNVTVTAAPTATTHAANKAYVDSVAGGSGDNLGSGGSTSGTLFTTNSNAAVGASWSNSARFLSSGTIFYTGNVNVATIASTSTFNNINANNITANSFTYSDKRLKRNFKPLGNISSILNLGTYRFNWKKDDKSDMGLIAQEVQEIYPELVRENDDGYLTVDYSRMVVPLLEVTKKQQAEIDELKAIVKELQNK